MTRDPTWTPDGMSPPDPDADRGGAIAKAYARWRQPLLRSLARFKGSIVSAEDALHDGVVKWASAQPALGSTDEHGAYLRKTVLNGVADEFRERRAGRRAQAITLEEAGAQAWATGDDACPLRTAAHRQRLERLGEALHELPERQREAFVLNRFDGLTQDEVAERMGISRRMVVKHLARAIAYCEVRVHYATATQMAQHHGKPGACDSQDNKNEHDPAAP